MACARRLFFVSAYVMVSSAAQASPYLRGATDASGPVDALASKVWLGVGGDQISWEDGENWSPSGVPTTNDSVQIPSGIVHASNAVQAASLAIDAGATLMLGSTGNVAAANLAYAARCA